MAVTVFKILQKLNATGKIKALATVMISLSC